MTKKSVPLSRSMDIPFNKLVLSQKNVRRVQAGVSIEDLAADIAVRGLVQSLNVRPGTDADGADTGCYEIPAGGRRFRALEWLVKTKRLANTAPIPCVLKGETADTSQEDDSLAENTHRVGLHPLDQYRAFLALRRQNMTEEEIAARYFVSVAVVKQRLRLASISPALLELYASEQITLDQLMAFSVTGDHTRQERVWETVSAMHSWQRGANDIRRMLIEATVAATDRRAIFVGLEAYEAAGGAVLRDLFHGDNGGWLQDAPLLDRLVSEKLQAVAEGLRGEGWKWIEVLPNVPFDHLAGLRTLKPMTTLSDEDQATLQAMKSEYTDIEEAFAGWEELPEEADLRLGELETAMEALEGLALLIFDPAEIARAGVVVSIGRDGEAFIQRGFVRPEDEARVADQEPDPAENRGREGDESPSITQPAERPTAIITLGGADTQPALESEAEEGDTPRPLPEKLILELTAYRTVALRQAIAENPRVAMTLLLHKLVSDAFQHRYGGTCLQVSVIPPQLYNIAPKGLDETPPALEMKARRDQWAEVIPHDDQALWDWLDAESDEVRADLLAFCISFGVNAIAERANPFGAGPTQSGIDTRLRQAGRLADLTHFDPVAVGWRPTAETYLNRVPRPRILEAVREGCGERAAQLIDHLKKGDMVTEAERLLADAGWLPEPLRGPQLNALSQAGEAVALPAFLTDAQADDEEPVVTVPPMAAE